MLGCALKLLGAVVYAANGEGANFWVMAVAGAVAVISPSGNEVRCRAFRVTCTAPATLHVGHPSQHISASD